MSTLSAPATPLPLEKGKRWAFRARGAMGTGVLLVCGVLTVFSAPWPVRGTWWNVGLGAAAWMLFFAGAAFRFWATLYIGGRKLHTLACEGPYSIVRNPLYLGTFLLWLSAAAFLQSATLAAGAVAGIFLYRWLTVPAEEQQLLATLGAPYADYCRRVPRFLPRPWRFHTPPTVQVSVHGLWLECRRAARWIWLPIAAQVVLHVRHEAAWLHLWRWP